MLGHGGASALQLLHLELPAQALCTPSLLTMAVGCSGVGDLPEPMAGFAMEKGYSWHGGDGWDLCQHLRLLQ